MTGRNPVISTTLYGTHYLDDVAKYLYDTDLSSSFRRSPEYPHLHHRLYGQLRPARTNSGPWAREVLLFQTMLRAYQAPFRTSSTISWPRPPRLWLPSFPSAGWRRPRQETRSIWPFSSRSKTGCGVEISRSMGWLKRTIPAQGISIGDLLDAAGLKALDSDGPNPEHGPVLLDTERDPGWRGCRERRIGGSPDESVRLPENLYLSGDER